VQKTVVRHLGKQGAGHEDKREQNAIRHEPSLCARADYISPINHPTIKAGLDPVALGCRLLDLDLRLETRGMAIWSCGFLRKMLESVLMKC
jgi:hypothetical protein